MKITLPQVGTNLQDQPLIGNFYSINPTAPSSWTNTTNEIAQGSVSYLSLVDVMGPSNAHKTGQELLATVQQRAEAIVQTGGHVSAVGLIKQLRAQAESMISQDSPAPVVEMIYGNEAALGIVLNVLWNLLPQV